MFFCGIWVEIKNPTASVPKKISTRSEKDCDDSCWSCWRNSHPRAHGIAKISSGFTVHQREAYSKLPRSCMEHLSRDLTIHLSSLLGSSSLRGHNISALSENKLPFFFDIPFPMPRLLWWVRSTGATFSFLPANQCEPITGLHMYIYIYIYVKDLPQGSSETSPWMFPTCEGPPSAVSSVTSGRSKMDGTFVDWKTGKIWLFQAISC